MPKKYPPLTYNEVLKIIKVLGFKFKDQKGSHEHYEADINGVRRKITLDKNDSPYNDFIIKSMIRQSGFSRKEFYGATKNTFKKIRNTL